MDSTETTLCCIVSEESSSELLESKGKKRGIDALSRLSWTHPNHQLYRPWYKVKGPTCTWVRPCPSTMLWGSILHHSMYITFRILHRAVCRGEHSFVDCDSPRCHRPLHEFQVTHCCVAGTSQYSHSNKQLLMEFQSGPAALPLFKNNMFGRTIFCPNRIHDTGRNGKVDFFRYPVNHQCAAARRKQNSETLGSIHLDICT